jgi:predicted GIY-YIG superfamily endonuclease
VTTRAPCRVCRSSRALTRRGLVWAHGARSPYGPPLGVRCPGAGEPPLGLPGPAVEPLPGQLLDPSPVVRAYPGGTVYLLHFDEPFGHARHYCGWASDLHARLAHHAAGTGANLLRHVAAAGIGWTLVRTWPGDRREERRLKRRGGATDRCPACRPGLEEHLLARTA